MKKIISLILTLLMCVSVFTVFSAIDVSAAKQTGYDRGYNGNMAGTGKIVSEGLDISEHQKGMNIQKIKDAGFDYVILRAGVKLNAGSNRKDYCFEDFYAQARRAGLDIGTYFYSQAKSVAEAKEEANAFISYIKGKKFEYPVYLDYENTDARNAIGSNATKATEICYAFMDTMRDAGYLVGLYGYAAWFDPGYGGWMANALDNNIGKKYDFWMANYFNNMKPENDRTSNYKNKYGMYQYTSSKTIAGWSGKLDHNVCYKDYPSIVKKYGFNGYDSAIQDVIKYDTSKSVLKTTATLKKGSANITQVTYLQKALDVLGYFNGTVNGEYDTSTVNAVRSYQKAKSISANGEANKETLKAIVEDIMYAEAGLKYLGYYGTTPNGDADEYLVGSILAFQKAEKLKESGTLNKSTKARLDQKIEDKAAGVVDKSTDKPTVAKPVETEAPATDAPATDAPTNAPAETEVEVDTQAPATEAPTTDAPITDAPIPDAPITDAPTIDIPVTDTPTIDIPVTDAPVTQAPVTQAPVTQAPVTQAPVTQAPVTQAPITQAPVTQAPITQAPATQMPTMQIPETQVTDTMYPATQAPATQYPATQAPTTQPSAEIGCGASIGLSAVTMVMVTGAAVLLKKKKED